MRIPDEELRELIKLQEANLNLQAYEMAKKHGPLERWEGTRELLAASHLAYSLGAPDLSYRLTMRAWHRDKADPEAIFFYSIETLQRRGPLHALMFMRRCSDFKADEKLTSWWYSLFAQIHSSLRDFGEAERWHARAMEANRNEPWVWTSKAYTFEQQDRYEAALECAREGFRLDGVKRSPVAALAHILTLLERDGEALEILQNVTAEVESAWLLKDLADLQRELGEHAAAYASLEKCFTLLPLMEPKIAEWHYGSLSDAAYMLGDRAKAIEYAGKAGNPFHSKVKESLEAAPEGAKRTVLGVSFLRQHHVTCAPATLTNIARYWDKHADHLGVVEQICYDGTPSYKERSWAEANGWRTREFTLNWDDATTLIDRGVPLTLATVHPGGGHLQAIIGYDAARGTYLLRDPYFRSTGEALAEELAEQQRSSGPRVMALVPEEKAELIEGIELFEADIYDRLFEVERAIEAHDRAAAGDALAKLKSEYPGHRLAYVAEWTVASYDSNNPGIRAAMRKLLELFPDDVNLRLNDLSISAPFTGRVERLEKLEKYSLAKESDPLIWQMFGYELGGDAAQHRRALKWLYKSARRSPGNALTLRFIADIFWAQRHLDQAAELYRVASSLNDKDEQLAYSYFLAMRHLRRENEALEVLADRVARFGRRSGDPVRSLFSALRELGRVEEGFAELSKALDLRPDDGDLMLFVADANARYGRTAEAAELLARAKQRAARPRWLRSSAYVAQIGGKLEEALDLWREVASADPTALDAHENIAILLKGLEGESAAKEHLRRICRKFPTSRNLQALRLQHLNDEPAEAIAVLRDLLRLDPQDIWAWRELSRWYGELGRFDRALDAADRALEADPNDATSRYFRARALELLKRNREAEAEYRAAIELDADNSFAIAGLMGVSRTLAAKREALEFIWERLCKQASNGNGLFAYREESSGILDRTIVLEKMRAYAAANPASLPALSAVTQQLADLGRMDEALAHARAVAEQFPLVHQAWSDLSVIHKIVGDTESEREALRRSLSVNPYWSYGVQQLADSLMRAGKFAEAREALTEALSKMPFDNFLLGYLADCEWHLGEKDRAIDTVRRALSIDPNYPWAWAAIKRWAEQMHDRDLPISMARELTRRKPKDVRAWVNLADMLDDGVYSDERIEALENALKIDPHHPQALAMKANTLADARRFDEAIAVARTRMPDGHRPEQLRYVESGIEMMRGRMIESVNLLVELTESSPGYLPGWWRLADIYRTNPDREQEYRKAAMELVRLAPRDALSYGYLGEACMKLGMKDEARDAFQQAVILEPSYSYAARSLFELLVESGDMDGAAKLAETVAEASPSTGLPIKAELALKLGRDVLPTLREVFAVPEIARENLDPLMEKVVAAALEKRDRSLVGLMESSAGDESGNPLSGRYLIDALWRLDGKKRAAEALSSLNGEAWAQGAARYMELLSEKNINEAIKFIDANAARLKEKTVTFGQGVYLLSVRNDLARSREWFRDWEQRRDLAPWMLWNAALVLWRNGLADEAEKMDRAALELPYDDTTNLHLTMLGLAAFKRGDTGEAARLQASVNSAALDGWDRFLSDVLSEAGMANSLIEEGDREGAKAIIESIVSQIIEMDPKATDRITKDLLYAVVGALLDRLGERWFAFKTKMKSWYWRLG